MRPVKPWIMTDVFSFNQILIENPSGLWARFCGSHHFLRCFGQGISGNQINIAVGKYLSALVYIGTRQAHNDGNLDIEPGHRLDDTFGDPVTTVNTSKYID